MSPSTSSSGAQTRSAPPRRTCARGLLSSVRRRMVARARSSCTVPISVLDTTTPMKSMFGQEPTSARHRASAAFSPLKGVNRLPAMICQTDLPGCSVVMLGLRPAAS